MAVSTIRFNPTETLTIAVKFPPGFRLRISIALALVRLAAFVGGMGFHGDVETADETKARIEEARKDIASGARPHEGRFKL